MVCPARAPAALPPCMGKGISQGSFLRIHSGFFCLLPGNISSLETGIVSVAALPPVCKTNTPQVLHGSEDVTGTPVWMSENVLLGWFCAAQLPHVMPRTDGSFWLSQSGVSCIGKAFRFGLTCRSPRLALAPLHAGGEHPFCFA